MADDPDREGLVSGSASSHKEREPAPGEDQFRSFLGVIAPYFITVFVLVMAYQIAWIAVEGYAIHSVYLPNAHNPVGVECSRLANYLLVACVTGFISALFLMIMFAMIASLFGVALNTQNRDLNFESQSQAFVMTMIVFACCFACMALFHLCWIIYGSVLVYPSATQALCSPNPNSHFLYTFVWWFITADWIGMAVVLVFWAILALYFAKKGGSFTAHDP